MPADCNCGPNSPLARALGCHCMRRGTAVIVSQLPQGCKAPLFRTVSGAIPSELALPLSLRRASFQDGQAPGDATVQYWIFTYKTDLFSASFIQHS